MMMVSDEDTPRFAVADLTTHYFARKSGKLEPFDLEDFDITFNSHNQPIVIPEEVSDVVDNDFDLPYFPPEFGGD